MLKKIVLAGAVGVLGIGVLVVGNEILFLLKQSNTTEKIQPRSSNENNTGQFITLLILTGLGAGGVGVVAGRVFLNKRQSGAVDSPSSDLKDESVDSSTSESGESTYSKIKNQIKASNAYGKAKDAVSNLPPASEVAERIKASNAYQKAKDFVLKQPAEGQGRGQGYGRIVGIVVVGGASLAVLNFLIRGCAGLVKDFDSSVTYRTTKGFDITIKKEDIKILGDYTCCSSRNNRPKYSINQREGQRSYIKDGRGWIGGGHGVNYKLKEGWGWEPMTDPSLGKGVNVTGVIEDATGKTKHYNKTMVCYMPSIKYKKFNLFYHWQLERTLERTLDLGWSPANKFSTDFQPYRGRKDGLRYYPKDSRREYTGQTMTGQSEYVNEDSIACKSAKYFNLI